MNQCHSLDTPSQKIPLDVLSVGDRYVPVLIHIVLGNVPPGVLATCGRQDADLHQRTSLTLFEPPVSVSNVCHILFVDGVPIQLFSDC